MLYVNKDYCIGCGICTKLSPNNFKIENKKAIVINSNIDVENYEHIKKTIDKCTANAITLKNKKDA
ncbi:MAG: ferredoxin [Paraclostridium sp.]